MVRGIFQSIKALNTWFGREPWTPGRGDLFSEVRISNNVQCGVVPGPNVATPSGTCVENRSGVD